MVIPLLLACTALLTTLAPTPPADLSNPWAGEPCTPGPWTIACPACEPPVAVVGLAVCVGPDGMAEALESLPGGFARWREINPNADLTVGME